MARDEERTGWPLCTFLVTLANSNMLSSLSLSYQPSGDSHSRPTKWPFVSPVADSDLYTFIDLSFSMGDKERTPGWPWSEKRAHKRSSQGMHILMFLKRAPSACIYAPLSRLLATGNALLQRGEGGG